MLFGLVKSNISGEHESELSFLRNELEQYRHFEYLKGPCGRDTFDSKKRK